MPNAFDVEGCAARADVPPKESKATTARTITPDKPSASQTGVRLWCIFGISSLQRFENIFLLRQQLCACFHAVAQNFAQQLQRINNTRVGEAIKYTRALARGLNQTLLSQFFQISRNRRLGQFQRSRQIAYPSRLPRQLVENEKAICVSERSTEIRMELEDFSTRMSHHKKIKRI